MPEERILDGTPNDLKPFSDAYNLKMEMEDEQAWMQGQYTLAAVMHGLSRLSKKGGKVNYPDKPMLREQAQKRKEEYLTENDKKKQRERLLMSLQIMQINFKNNHKNDEQGG